MKKAKPISAKTEPRKIRPALTPEARENQLISLAVDLVEQRLLDGTAFLKRLHIFSSSGL